MPFKQDTEITPVIFRRYRDGGVVALFPTVPGTTDVYTCSSYMHVGQHGSAHPEHVVRETKRATPAEYAALKTELEGAPYGYRLRIYSRLQYQFVEDRRNQLRQHAT